MKIGLLGYTDKRLITYPLLKILQALGETIVITDNRHFLRMVGDNEHLLNIRIVVTSDTPDEVWEEIGQEPDDFDYIVYDIRETFPSDVDLYFHIRGSEKLDDGEDMFLDCIDEYTKIKIAYDGKGSMDKETTVFPVTSLSVAYVESVECNRWLPEILDKKLLKILPKLLEKPLALDAKKILALMKRGWKQ